MDRTEIKPGMIVTYKEEHIGSVTWIEGMEEYIGKLFLVHEIDGDDNTALCECMGELMLWLEIDWLEPWEGEQHETD